MSIKSMSLDRAIEILNKHNHRFDEIADDCTLEWCVDDLAGTGQPVENGAVLNRYITQYKDDFACRGNREYCWLTEFEACAIAEKYLRMGK